MASSHSQAAPSIVIIGAGISGLAAADKLINTYNFQNVIILEASDRIGGRIHPVRLGDSDEYLQLGAQWLHGSQNPVTELAVQLGLIPNVYTPADDIYTKMRFIDEHGHDAPQLLRDEFIQLVTEGFGKLFDRKFRANFDPSRSFGHVMDDLYLEWLASTRSHGRFSESDVKIANAMYQATRSFMEQYYGVKDLDSLSLEIPESSDDPVNWPISISMSKSGYKTILDEMARRVPVEKYVRFNALVQQIRWDSNHAHDSKPITIYMKNGELVNADHVIVTCSLGHLKQYADRLFDPPLPKAKANVINSLGYDTVARLHLIFDKPYWPVDTAEFNLIRTDSTITRAPEEKTELTRMLEVFSACHSPPVLMSWIAGHHVPAFEKATDAEISHAAMTVLRRHFDNPSIPAPRVVRSAWLSNPLFLGSYSHNTTANNSIRDRQILAEPLSINLIDGQQIPIVSFAGEATNPFHHSCVHGAFSTGVREADRLAQIYGRS